MSHFHVNRRTFLQAVGATAGAALLPSPRLWSRAIVAGLSAQQNDGLADYTLTIYMAIDAAMGKKAWDPYPYILLNLFLSMLASVQAPIIMMSQNRQDTKDRLRGELDYDVNRRAEVEIQGLARKLNLLGEKIGDVEEMLREKLARG